MIRQTICLLTSLLIFAGCKVKSSDIQSDKDTGKTESQEDYRKYEDDRFSVARYNYFSKFVQATPVSKMSEQPRKIQLDSKNLSDAQKQVRDLVLDIALSFAVRYQEARSRYQGFSLQQKVEFNNTISDLRVRSQYAGEIFRLESAGVVNKNYKQAVPDQYDETSGYLRDAHQYLMSSNPGALDRPTRTDNSSSKKVPFYNSQGKVFGYVLVEKTKTGSKSPRTTFEKAN